MMTGNKETRKVVSKTFFIFKQQSFENERDLVTTVNVDKLEHHGDGDAWGEANKRRATEDERQVLKLSPRTHHLGLLKNRENVTPGAHVMRPKGFRKLTTRAISRNEKRNWFAPNIGKNKIGFKKEQKINSLKPCFALKPDFRSLQVKVLFAFLFRRFSFSIDLCHFAESIFLHSNSRKELTFCELVSKHLNGEEINHGARRCDKEIDWKAS